MSIIPTISFTNPKLLCQVKRKKSISGGKSDAGYFKKNEPSLKTETSAAFPVQEELDFQFDEELDVPVGRINTFTDW